MKTDIYKNKSVITDYINNIYYLGEISSSRDNIYTGYDYTNYEIPICDVDKYNSIHNNYRIDMVISKKNSDDFHNMLNTNCYKKEPARIGKRTTYYFKPTDYLYVSSQKPDKFKLYGRTFEMGDQNLYVLKHKRLKKLNKDSKSIFKDNVLSLNNVLLNKYEIKKQINNDITTLTYIFSTETNITHFGIFLPCIYINYPENSKEQIRLFLKNVNFNLLSVKYNTDNKTNNVSYNKINNESVSENIYELNTQICTKKLIITYSVKVDKVDKSDIVDKEYISESFSIYNNDPIINTIDHNDKDIGDTDEYLIKYSIYEKPIYNNKIIKNNNVQIKNNRYQLPQTRHIFKREIQQIIDEYNYDFY
jgi:hypothetical protein